MDGQVSVWDILNSLTLEYRMVLKGRFGPSIVVYFVARCSMSTSVSQH
jgi:hypothetical protein